jgi:hypothetical protein
MSVRASFLFRLAGSAFRSGNAVAAAKPRDAAVVAMSCINLVLADKCPHRRLYDWS